MTIRWLLAAAARSSSHAARPDFSPTEACVACRLEDLLDLLKPAKPGDGLAIVL